TKDLDKTITELSQEIVERKKAEAKVHTSLEEKEVLLKEIHHRVKNNLQVISSLLYLQSTKVKDKETLNLFEDSQNRIKSMALIHEKLYQSKDFADINFFEYVHGLLQHLNRSYKKTGLPVKTVIDMKEINLSLDTAISCGLIVNELVTNAYKYAFPPDWVSQHIQEDGLQIKIKMEKGKENKYILTVSNNGISIPENLDIKKVNSLGLKLVSSMVQQLDGSIEISRDTGTQFKISFEDIK
ncbi:MAG: histidine kinase dimerization/phosphoacceptor domain -containing protein, partial [Ignavibacteriaceae bacterium]